MNMLRNFTIRFVMLAILGIFCLMWAGVGLYSTWSLSRVSDGNEVDRQLVKQMTVLSQGNDQYFRFVTRLSRAMEVKAAGGTPDLASAQQALDNMGKKLAEMKAISHRPNGPPGLFPGDRCLAGAARTGRDAANAAGETGRAGRLSSAG